MYPNTGSLTLFNENQSNFDWNPTGDEIACALELNTLSTFRTQFRWLRMKFRGFRSMIEAPLPELDIIPASSAYLRHRFLDQRSSLRIGAELEKVPDGINIITYFDSRYPAQLRDLYTPPPLLYVKGDIEFNHAQSISIVGSRTYSEYGRQMAEHFAYQLAGWGFTIISGGARGIDSFAHKAALDSGGSTIAVLGSGIDLVFPSENKKLFNEIPENGAVVSEFPMGTIPERFNFPMRNRIIAGLGRGTMVIEAPEKSGALITADLALQLGREVFAIPGRLTDGRSGGANRLIRDGAQIALDPTDIPLRFGLIVVEGEAPESPKFAEQLTGDEALVYGVIGLEARDADQIVREVGRPAQDVLAALLVLQTKGLVRELPGSRFVKPVIMSGGSVRDMCEENEKASM